MDTKVKAKYIKISPRKVRLVANLVRGLEAGKALAQLQFLNKKSANPIAKLLSSAIANALNNYGLDKNNLFIKEISVDQGVTMKRWMPRAHGRATPLKKKTSHINLTLGEIKDSGIVEAKKQTLEKPVNLEEAAKQIENKKNKETGTAKKDKETKPEISAQEKMKASPKKGFAGKFFQRKSG